MNASLKRFLGLFSVLTLVTMGLNAQCPSCPKPPVPVQDIDTSEEVPVEVTE